MTTSWQARLVAHYIALTRKRNWRDADAVRRAIATRDPFTPPRKLRAFFERRDLENHAYWVGGTGTRTIVYFHGGGYVHEVSPQHFELARWLAGRCAARVVVPIYPLAPEHPYDVNLAWCNAMVEQLATPMARVSFTGDSAGGGLCVALSMWRRDQGLTLPGHLGLISPALDATVANPEAARVDDPWLAIDGVREAGRMYGGDHTRHPYVSPLYGRFEALPPTVTFVGTRDIFHPDCVDFHAQLDAACVPSRLHVADGMIHVWHLLPIPEAAVAREQLATHILESLP